MPPETEAWLARELAFLQDAERRMLRRAEFSRRARTAALVLAAAALCGGAWALLNSRALRG
ncbi:MAG TPA: hypothetical protein VGM10_01280 [Actinocrinis sp.]